MSNAMEVFSYGDSPIRTVEGENGEVWFVGKDIATLLGYERTADAIAQHCKKAVAVSTFIGVGKSPTPHIDPQTKIIPESDLWRLIIKSNMPEAVKIEAWVMEEVLPSIRKSGGYGTPNDAMGLIAASVANQTQMMGMMVELMAKMVEKSEAQANPLNGITISFSQNPKENEDERNEFVDAVSRYLLENREGRTQGQILSDINSGVGNSTKIRWLKQYIGRVWRVEIIMGNRYVYTII